MNPLLFSAFLLLTTGTKNFTWKRQSDNSMPYAYNLDYKLPTIPTILDMNLEALEPIKKKKTKNEIFENKNDCVTR